MKDRSFVIALTLSLFASLAVAEGPVPTPSSPLMATGPAVSSDIPLSPFEENTRSHGLPAGPPTCNGNNIWVGSASNETPNLVTPQCSAAGTFDATLACTEGAADLDLYLELQSCSWFGCGFTSLDASTTASCDEDVTTSGASGTYRWRISHYSGPAETFYLCTNQC